MLKLIYKHNTHPDYPYTIVQSKPGEAYFFFARNTLIGSIEKVAGEWAQVSGRQTLDEVVQGMGKFIEKNS